MTTTFTLFTQLLPELQGEVAVHVTELIDRVSMARTSHLLYQCVAPTLPKLPEPWRGAWEDVKRHATAPLVETRRAVLEMNAMGILQWPGVFHRADVMLLPRTDIIAWRWWGYEKFFAACLTVRLRTGRWEIALAKLVRDYGSDHEDDDDDGKFATLRDIPRDKMEALRGFVGSPPRMQWPEQ